MSKTLGRLVRIDVILIENLYRRSFREISLFLALEGTWEASSNGLGLKESEHIWLIDVTFMRGAARHNFSKYFHSLARRLIQRIDCWQDLAWHANLVWGHLSCIRHISTLLSWYIFSYLVSSKSNFNLNSQNTKKENLTPVYYSFHFISLITNTFDHLTWALEHLRPSHSLSELR